MARREPRPAVIVRMHPEALRLLKQRADYQRGRRSGVAEEIRRIVYAAIGFDSGQFEAVPGGDLAED